MDIFLCYSRQDLEVALAIKSGLLSAGFTVWCDDAQLHGGQQLGTEIERAIQEAGCVLACLSPDSVKTGWVRAEMRRGKGKLLPVKIKGFDSTLDLEADLDGVMIRDVTAWVQSGEARPWVRLVEDCRAMLGRPKEPTAAAAAPPPPRREDVAVSIHNSGTVGTLIGHVNGPVTFNSGGKPK